MNQKILTFLVCAVCFGLVACSESEGIKISGPESEDRAEKSGTKENQDCFSIVNGNETTAHEAVVSLGRSLGNNQYYFCTGTFIATNAILTAAHCLDDSATGGMRYVSGADISLTGYNDRFNAAPTANAAITHGTTYRKLGFNPSDDNHRQHDVVILIFDDDIAPAVVLIATAIPAAGSGVRLVGYGQVSLNTPLSGALKRRTGTNSLTTNPLTSLLVVDGPLSPEAGTNITMGVLGDSGGPLLFNDEVIGIFSSVIPANDLDLFVDVTSSKVTDLLTRAADQGAEIPGYFTFPDVVVDEDPPADPPLADPDTEDEADDVATLEAENDVATGTATEEDEKDKEKEDGNLETEKFKRNKTNECD